MNDQLWISTLEKMNDPMDLGFYIRGAKYTDQDIRDFQQKLNHSFVVISLASKVQNRRLWNYYTDGMRGFALDYNVASLINALKRLGTETPTTGKVEYGDKKMDLSDQVRAYLEGGIIPNLSEKSFLFQKDTSWSSEVEYRIVVKSGFLRKYKKAEEKQGMLVNGVIPSQIYVGYKMDEVKLDTLAKYANDKGIELRMLIPDFRSASSEQFKSIALNGKYAGMEEIERMIEDLTGINPRKYYSGH